VRVRAHVLLDLAGASQDAGGGNRSLAAWLLEVCAGSIAAIVCDMVSYHYLYPCRPQFPAVRRWGRRLPDTHRKMGTN